MRNLKDYIKECVHIELDQIKHLNKIETIDENIINEYFNLNYKSSLNEMSRINTNEYYGYFPYNKFRIVVWSNDHNPPHFHVIVEDWDIVVDIENGSIIKTKQEGKNSTIYTYVEKNINDWLDTNSAINEEHTNREIALIAWKMNND